MVEYENIQVDDAKVVNIDDFHYHDKLWAIGNEYGLLALCFESCESDAIDESYGRGFLTAQEMSVEDFEKYQREGWDDSYILVGNASEPIWGEHLWIREIKKPKLSLEKLCKA